MIMILGGRRVDEKLPVTGAAITASAAIMDQLQMWNGVGEVLLTWFGVLTGMHTLVWDVVKFVDYIKMKKEERYAKLQRELEK
jgi:hypothetical protein